MNRRRLLVAVLGHATRAAIYSALAVALLLAATVTKPAEPLELHWRTATEQEQREYERQRLADFLEEARRQQ